MQGEARPAFYALRHGGWRDYVTLLHLPYTAWHLSYVAIGAAIATRFSGALLGASILGFFLGVGLAAHALDELAGRPLGTGIPRSVLWTIAVASLGAAVILGVLGAVEVSWWMLAFVGFGAFIVPAYNLELFGGRFHSTVWFALSWGAFPALTSYFAQSATLRWPAVLVSLACFELSVAQRRLSTPARTLRRRVVALHGKMVFQDGTEAAVDEATLLGGAESSLRSLSLALPLLAVGLVAARLL